MSEKLKVPTGLTPRVVYKKEKVKQFLDCKFNIMKSNLKFVNHQQTITIILTQTLNLCNCYIHQHFRIKYY